MFIAGFLYRLTGFLPAAIAARGQAVMWSEVVGGMLRTQLLNDLLSSCLAKKFLSQDDCEQICAAGSAAINSNRADWLEFVVGMVAEHGSSSLKQVRGHLRDLLPFSDTIRYIQIGNPETVLVDDASTMQRVEADLALRERLE